MKPKTKQILTIAGVSLCALLLCATMFFVGIAFEQHRDAQDKVDQTFKRGFEDGVRYCIMALVVHEGRGVLTTEEADVIPEITEEAKQLYWRVEIGKEITK